MHESSAFEIFLDEGKEIGLKQGQLRQAHRTLLRQGRRRFEPPTADTEATLLAIKDLDRLDRLTDAILTAASWDELLATP